MGNLVVEVSSLVIFLIVAQWCHLAVEILVNTGSGNGLVPSVEIERFSV